ncbi:hypothetical protein CAT723_00820 [Corynebacterium ammoniagenes]|uniref:Transposase n=1 Tax=Corynebacterium ammoniagenes TaxID=1697 RepID=A0AAV5G4P2_CORAM|nr:hypothetical protein CAT723_00820 [Corynebacterium ammoniagenes]
MLGFVRDEGRPAVGFIVQQAFNSGNAGSNAIIELVIPQIHGVIAHCIQVLVLDETKFRQTITVVETRRITHFRVPACDNSLHG